MQITFQAELFMYREIFFSLLFVAKKVDYPRRILDTNQYRAKPQLFYGGFQNMREIILDNHFGGEAPEILGISKLNLASQNEFGI